MSAPAAPSAPPIAPKSPRIKTVGSVTFEDPYADLHDDTPESLAWQWAQDAYAQAEIRRWPGFEPLRQRIAASGSAVESFLETPRRCLGGRWVWLAASPASPMRTVWTADRLEDAGRPIVEMGQLVGPERASKTLPYFYEPSPDGRYVALIICSGGAMVGEWRVVETATGRVLPITIPGPAYTGALPGWLPDGSGFYFNDRDDRGWHRFRFIPVDPGVAARPDVGFEPALVPLNVSGLTPEVSPTGRRVIGLAGPHERIAYVIGDTRTNTWGPFLPDGYSGECSGGWLDDETYVARAHSDALPRGRLVAIPAATSRDQSTWRELVPHGDAVLRAVGVFSGRIVVSDVLDVSSRYRSFDLDGRDERVAPLEGPGSSAIGYLNRRFDRSEAVIFDYQTFTTSTAIYHWELPSHRLTVVRPARRTVSGIRVSQRFATSLDGSRIPYFLVHRADVPLDRPRPTLVTGYGGFNVALMPSFLGHLTPFVEAGGVYVQASLRGGAEYGKQWHESGRLACKWNVFLDLFAVTERLIADRVTEPAKLGMTGASNGGLLAGVAIVHRPELWRVVAPVVPLFDQMEFLPDRPELAGVKAIFLEDYGDPSDPSMSKILYSYSPYHNIRDGVAYPAVFQVFGEKDLGCMPFHGRKFTARLQAATTSGHPVLLRVWRDTGHGALDPEVATLQAAEWLGFVMRELGMEVGAAGQSA
jgi:prolyl oligopeptidase